MSVVCFLITRRYIHSEKFSSGINRHMSVEIYLWAKTNKVARSTDNMRLSVVAAQRLTQLCWSASTTPRSVAFKAQTQAWLQQSYLEISIQFYSTAASTFLGLIITMHFFVSSFWCPAFFASLLTGNAAYSVTFLYRYRILVKVAQRSHPFFYQRVAMGDSLIHHAIASRLSLFLSCRQKRASCSQLPAS